MPNRRSAIRAVSSKSGETTNRERPGLGQALAAVRAGDTLVVPKLDRLARSVPDPRDIGDFLVACGVKLSLGGTLYDPADPMGKMLRTVHPCRARRLTGQPEYAPSKQGLTWVRAGWTGRCTGSRRGGRARPSRDRRRSRGCRARRTPWNYPLC